MTRIGKTPAISLAAHRVTAAVMLAGGLALLVVFGVAGVLRTDVARLDFWVLHSAGQYFLDLRVPYGVFELTPGVANAPTAHYAYPPHFAPLIALAAMLPLKTATLLVIGANMVACLLLAWAVARQMDLPPGRDSELHRVLVAAIIIGSPFAAHVVWLGNTSLIIMAALVIAWRLADEDREIAAGILLAMAAWKPQLALLPTLWLLLDRRSLLLVSAGVTALALSVWHIAVFGFTTSIVAWVTAVGEYSRALHSGVGYIHSTGLQDLVHALWRVELRLEIMAFPALGILWWKRRYFSSLERLALLCTLSVLFMPVQAYDLVALAPLAGAVVARQAAPGWRMVLAGAVALLFVPAGLVRALAIPELSHWRVAVIIAIAAWLVQDAVRAARRAEKASGALPAGAPRPARATVRLRPPL